MVVFVGIAAVVSRISILLREDNLKYKNLMDSSGAASVILDKNERIIHTNQTFEKITGYTLKELKRNNWVSIFDNEYRGKALMLYEKSVIGDENNRKNDDLIVKSKKGDEYYVLATIKHIHELELTLISLVDITEKKKTEKMVAVQKERYKKLFQQSIDGIFIHTCDGIILNANAEALRIIGMNLQEIKKTSLKSIIPVEFHDEYEMAIQNELEGGKIFKLETWTESRTGERIDLDLRSVMVDKDTKVVLSIVRDITLRKKNEKALEIALKKLNLLSSITRHDILNHIMVAKMNLEFAKEDVSDESVRNYLDKSALAIDTIHHQIEFSRDYQDMGGNPPKWHKLENIIDSCAGSQHLPPNIKVVKNFRQIEIFADPMFEKVICNLIGNTIMHGGAVNKISIDIEEKDDYFNLMYRDDGEGIPEKDKQKIFRPGYGRNQGFGLYLVSEILSITGASIIETGIQYEGVCFEIRIPGSDVRYTVPQQDQ
ncbi:MAG: PAS domain-containing sensor histidine kinase [Methanomicrobiaceae archaeon]|nr:PAS domain-containing sensor histidine kinase [Methanomicrobiaceae archaeon]